MYRVVCRYLGIRIDRPEFLGEAYQTTFETIEAAGDAAARLSRRALPDVEYSVEPVASDQPADPPAPDWVEDIGYGEWFWVPPSIEIEYDDTDLGESSE